MKSSRGHHNNIAVVAEAASNAVKVLMSRLRSRSSRVMDDGGLWVNGREKTKMTAGIVNNGLKWKKIMISNPTYTRFNNVLLYILYNKEDVCYRACVPTLLSGRNTINLRLISDYRNEDKDHSPEPRRKAKYTSVS